MVASARTRQIKYVESGLSGHDGRQLLRKVIGASGTGMDYKPKWRQDAMGFL